MSDVRATALRKARLKLLAIAGVFAVPFLVALVLTLSGWQPGAKGNGEPIVPQRNFVAEHVQVRMADGTDWPWRASEPRLTLVALPGPDCAERCFATLTALAKARVMLNRNQKRLRLLYLGTPPAGPEGQGMRNYWQVGSDVDNRFAAWRPLTADSVGAVLVESNGTALARYPAGFDPAGVLRDMRKVIK